MDESSQRHRSTKIICTLGPATDSAEMIARLIEAGANVFRLNMSHGKAEWAHAVVARIRAAADKLGANIAVLFDLQGPSIRTGELKAPFDLKKGDRVEFRLASAEAHLPFSTTVNYEGMMQDVSRDSTLVVDNGNILMQVEQIFADRIVCRVITEGVLGSRRHINLPGVALRLPALTEKDMLDLQTAVECEADYVGMSFVRNAGHLSELRALIERQGGHAQIVAKIEDQQAIRHIGEIITAADVIMVARGDLGIEVNIEEMPIVQQRIIRDCHRLGKRCIIATHMLESMITQPTPTRAEVTDVSYAVFEQADAVMLSGETSVGAYPVRCVETLDRIARRMERASDLQPRVETILRNDRQKALKAAVDLADSIDHAGLVIFTRRGILAVAAAVLRPKHAPIFAFCHDSVVTRRLALARDIVAFQTDFHQDTDKMVNKASRILRMAGYVREGQPLVVVGDCLQNRLLADSILFTKA